MSFHIQSFSDNIHANGGVRRSEQIISLAASEGLSSVAPPTTRECRMLMLARPFSLFKAALLTIRVGLPALSFKGMRRSLRYGTWLVEQLRKHKDEPVWIELTPERNILIGALLAASGRSYVAFPHNIEFLVPQQSQSVFRGPSKEFLIERTIFRKAKRVVTISNFDSAVVRSLGVTIVQQLPYSPVAKHREELLKIRSRRTHSVKDGIIILGSVGNRPTRDGILQVLRQIAGIHTKKKFTLAGFGTELLEKEAPSSVSVIGSISNESLIELLVKCEAMIICQPQTSGMLTRLVEADVAGVPVWLLGDYLQADDPSLSLQITKRYQKVIDLPIFEV